MAAPHPEELRRCTFNWKGELLKDANLKHEMLGLPLENTHRYFNPYRGDVAELKPFPRFWLNMTPYEYKYPTKIRVTGTFWVLRPGAIEAISPPILAMHT